MSYDVNKHLTLYLIKKNESWFKFRNKQLKSTLYFIFSQFTEKVEFNFMLI